LINTLANGGVIKTVVLIKTLANGGVIKTVVLINTLASSTHSPTPPRSKSIGIDM